jgi:hypothetical protein
VSPEETRALALACLAEHTLRSLGVEATKPTAEIVMNHAINQACLELEMVENVLERKLEDDPLVVDILTGGFVSLANAARLWRC